MGINSSLGLIGVEGEQGLDGHYMYLLKIPRALVSETAGNYLSRPKESTDGENTIKKIERDTKVVQVTVSDKGVKPGDRRANFDEEEE